MRTRLWKGLNGSAIARSKSIRKSVSPRCSVPLWRTQKSKRLAERKGDTFCAIVALEIFQDLSQTLGRLERRPTTHWMRVLAHGPRGVVLLVRRNSCHPMRMAPIIVTAAIQPAFTHPSEAIGRSRDRDRLPEDRPKSRDRHRGAARKPDRRHSHEPYWIWLAARVWRHRSFDASTVRSDRPRHREMRRFPSVSAGRPDRLATDSPSANGGSPDEANC